MAIPNPDATFAAVVRTFELRHIFSHESAMGMPVDRNEIELCVARCALFMGASESLLWALFIPSGLSQAEHTERASKNYQAAVKAQRGVQGQLERELDEHGRKLLRQAQRDWKRYSKADAEFSTHLYKGGSAHAMARLIAMRENTADRTDELKKYVEEFAGE